MRSHGLSCPPTVHKCVGVCVWFEGGTDNNCGRRAQPEKTNPAGEYVWQRDQSKTNVNQKCLLWQRSPAVLSTLCWTDGHLSPSPLFLCLISQGQYKSLKVTFQTSLPLSANSFAIISGKQNIFSHRLCISPIYCSKNKGAGRRFKNELTACFTYRST